MRLPLIIILVSILTSFSVWAQQEVAHPDSTNADALQKPVFTLDLLDEEVENQNISGLLQSSRDVFLNIAGFNFSAARFRVRGYDAQNFNVSMNGINLNDPENGRAIWAYWGGLNDITRYQETKPGITASPYSFSGLGGFSNINARASSLRKGTRFSYAAANRTYRNRVMLTHSTGMMNNGWAFSLSGSLRWSDEGYVEGTHYTGASYFLSAEKKINKQHSFGLAAYGAPTSQGLSSITTQETYDLTDNNFYNSYWGYQNGEKRNSRVRYNHKPRIIASHYFDVNPNTQINTSAFYSFGKGGYTRLNWYDAADPRPEYYKNLPSYYEDPGYEEQYAASLEQWRSLDPNTTQISWDDFYFANGKNLYTVENASGIDGNNITGNRAKYIIEDARQDISNYGFNSVISHKKNNLLYTGGISASLYKSMNYKEIADLLGSDFWVDVDQFAERDFEDEDKKQSNLQNPNNVVTEGDAFGYNYDININKYDVFGQVEGTGKKIDWFAAANFSSTTFWRTGNVQNGLYPNESLGDSKKQSFNNYGLKGGILYKVTGRHLLGANAMVGTRAPLSRTAFISPRTRNEIISNLDSEKITSGDVNYFLRYPKLKARATVFYTSIKDQTWARSFYHDELNSFVNYVMTGVDQLFTGVELGLEANVTSTIVASAAYTTGQYIYNSRPNVTINQDNSTELLADNKQVYLENFRIGGIPQTAASFGLKYNSPKYWYTGFNINWFDDIYLDANPDRRTVEALSKYVDTDPQIDGIVNQTQVESDYTVNFFIGKSWKIKEQYLRLNININNVLNNTDFQTGGFEQLRYDASDIEKFPPRVGYMYGTTFFAMITYSF